MGAVTGIAQWWHLAAAAQDDKYLSRLVELREIFQHGDDWEIFMQIYEYLQQNYEQVGSAAQAAWITTRAVIDPILLGGLGGRGGNGAAS